MIIYEHTFPTAMIGVAVGLAAVLCVLGYWLYAKRDWAVLVMVALRVGFLALLAWCLLLPGERKTQTLQQKSRFVVIVDKSKSMTMIPPAKDTTSRWSVVQSALQQAWPEALVENCDVDCYSLAGDVSPKLTIQEARSLTPDGTSTLLCDGLKKTFGRYTGVDVVGCLLLSDGIDTREAFTEWSLEKRTTPIYTLLTEKDAVWDEEPDVRVEAVNTPRRVTVGWQTELKAVVSGQGTKGQPINVQLYKDGVKAQEQQTQVPAGGGSKEVAFQLEHADVGINTYRVVVPPMPKETQTNDNEFSVSVQVLDSKNRLLYVEGPPRWESKYLTRALRESKQVTPVIFLRGAKGKFMTFGVRGDVSPDMTESQLTFFKMIILGNLSGEELGEERARNILKFVEQGGSLVLLGGTKGWAPDGFVSTSLKKLMPAKQFTGKAVNGEYPIALTETGRLHPAFAGDPTLWEKMPPILSVFPNVVPSPAARVLVNAKMPGGDQPLILAQDFGQGKVVAIFTDSLWKWHLSPDAIKNKPYPRFWDQLIAWMTPKEEKKAGRTLEVFLDNEQCFLGEEIGVTARWIGATEPPAGLTVNAEITAPDKRKIPFAMTREVDQVSGGKAVPTFNYKYKGELAGLYSVLVSAEPGGTRMESDPLSFTVKPFTPESMPRPADVKVLKALSENSGGAFFESVEALDKALSGLNVKKTEQTVSEYRTLWQHWLIITCLAALVSIEWIFRKLKNMP